jgi:N utilization substance protein A
LGGEKIDVIEWSPDSSTFIAKALSPAKVLSVQLEEGPVEGKTASVTVPDDQLSLAIGRAGQNARLAAKLTGWRIDIQGVTEAATWALQKVNEDPNVLPALGPVAEMLPPAASILRRHEEEALPYNSEELVTMRQVIEGVRGHYASLRDAERARRLEEEMARRTAIRAAEAERRATIEAALGLIPPQAREFPLAEIGLSTRVLGHLDKAGLATVWDVMERLAEGDEGLLKLEGIGPKSLAEVKQCVDALALPEVEEETPVEEVALEAKVPEAEAVPSAEIELAEEAIEEEAEVEPEAALEAEAPEAVEEVLAEEMPGFVLEEEEEEIDLLAGDKPQKKKRRKQRELVYDEKLGEVVALRRRKRGDDVADEADEWESY